MDKKRIRDLQYPSLYKFSKPRLHLVLSAICVGLISASACTSTKAVKKQEQQSIIGFSGQLSVERAINEARTYMRQRSLAKKYDLNSAEAYDKGKYWEVCFRPKSGWFRHCVEIPK